MFPNSHQQQESITVSMARPGLQSHYAPGGKSFMSNGVNSQPFVGVPIMAPPISVLPAPGSIVGTTDIRYTHCFYLFLFLVIISCIVVLTQNFFFCQIFFQAIRITSSVDRLLCRFSLCL